MTEVQIYGGPRDGETFDLAGNPDRGELVVADGSRFRVYDRVDGVWVGVWVGFVGPPYTESLEDDQLTDAEAARLLKAVREHASKAEVLAAVVTALLVGGAVGCAFGAMASLASLAVAGAARLAGGYTNLTLGAAGVGAVVLAVDVIRRPVWYRK